MRCLKLKKYANENFLYTWVQPGNSLSNHLRVNCQVGEWRDHVYICKTSLWFVLNNSKYTI